MPELIAFRNFHYRKGKKNPNLLKQLVAPPYDVISKQEEMELKNKHENNICHIILPESYEVAGKKLNQMIKNEILVCHKDRCICVYGIDYKKPDTGELIRRYGFVGLLKLVEIFPSQDGVIPHEATFRKYTEDRYKLIHETDANFSPIFTIYNGNGSADQIIQKYVKRKPFLYTEDREGFIHKVWEIREEQDISKIQEIVRKNSIIIADGHHRYITSLRRSRHGGCKYIMALFIDFNDPGLIIYTSHRQIHKMPVEDLNNLRSLTKDFFTFQKVKNYDILKQKMKKYRKNHIFGCFFKDSYLVFTLRKDVNPVDLIEGNHSNKWKRLDIPILHEILFKKCLNLQQKDISFIKNVKRGLKSISNGNIEALFIVNATRLEEIHQITQLGEIMPQKSTYFYPKPLSGLIIHKHTDEIE